MPPAMAWDGIRVHRMLENLVCLGPRHVLHCPKLDRKSSCASQAMHTERPAADAAAAGRGAL